MDLEYFKNINKSILKNENIIKEYLLETKRSDRKFLAVQKKKREENLPL